MAFLKQMQLAPVRERQGVVGDHSQLPALCFPEGTRALDPIEGQEATVIFKPLARLGADEFVRGTRLMSRGVRLGLLRCRANRRHSGQEAVLGDAEADAQTGVGCCSSSYLWSRTSMNRRVTPKSLASNLTT